MLGSSYKREVTYTSSKFRTPSPGQEQEDRHARVASSLSTIQTQVAPSLHYLVPVRTAARHLAERHLVLWRPLLVLPMTPTYRRFHLECCCPWRVWTTTEWNQVLFSDESRSNLGSNDNHICVWRVHDERFNPAFGLQCHTTPIPGVMLWCKVLSHTTLGHH